ncbi:MAG: NUDIX hydrolase [Candidatus Nanoarchaeia archaeon]|nr:NUDIX hydrolase [Candidatus Nanoarchaeia archaeon]
MKEIIRTEDIYDNFIKLRAETVKYGDEEYIYDVLTINDGVCVLPFISEEELVLVKHYRHAIRKIILEAVTGVIDKDETPEDAAKRELKEETGYKAEKVELLSVLTPYPSLSDHKMYFFRAKDLVKGKSNKEITEEIRTVKINYNKLLEEIRENKYESMVLHTALFLNQIK